MTGTTESKCLKIKGSLCLVNSKYHSRFFVQVGHETKYAAIIGKSDLPKHTDRF